MLLSSKFKRHLSYLRFTDNVNRGWDQSTFNGANLSFPQALGLDDKNVIDSWLLGLISAAPLIASCVVGVWLTDPLNWLAGRRWTIFISGVFCGLPVIGSALAQSWQQLFVTRLLMGIGMGCKLSFPTSAKAFRGS